MDFLTTLDLKAILIFKLFRKSLKYFHKTLIVALFCFLIQFITCGFAHLTFSFFLHSISITEITRITELVFNYSPLFCFTSIPLIYFSLNTLSKVESLSLKKIILLFKSPKTIRCCIILMLFYLLSNGLSHVAIKLYLENSVNLFNLLMIFLVTFWFIVFFIFSSIRLINKYQKTSSNTKKLRKDRSTGFVFFFGFLLVFYGIYILFIYLYFNFFKKPPQLLVFGSVFLFYYVHLFFSGAIILVMFPTTYSNKKDPNPETLDELLIH